MNSGPTCRAGVLKFPVVIVDTLLCSRARHTLRHNPYHYNRGPAGSVQLRHLSSKASLSAASSAVTNVLGTFC